MNRSDLRSFCRTLADDAVTPYQVSDTQFNDFIQEALDEACLRARLLYDMDAGPITLVVDQSTYNTDTATLGRNYFFFERMYLVAKKRELIPVSMDQLDRAKDNWQSEGSGIPEYYLIDQLPDRIRFNPTPSEVDTVQFRGYYMPASIANDTDELVINTIHHRNLSDWVLYRFYSIHDADIAASELAAVHLMKFEKNFGRRMSAKSQQLQYKGNDMTFQPRFTINVPSW